MPRKYTEWTTKQRRQYQHLISGIKRQRAKKLQVRVITLTSSNESSWEHLNSNWQVLRKRIERRYGVKVEYWKLKTNEGNGVLHIVYTGCYIPQRWLSNAWNTIHGARIVYIQALFRKQSPKRLASYIAGHYLAGHDYLTFTRQSESWGWCFRGRGWVWRQVLATSSTLYIAIYKFDIILRQREPIGWYNDHRKTKKWGMIGSMHTLPTFFDGSRGMLQQPSK